MTVYQYDDGARASIRDWLDEPDIRKLWSDDRTASLRAEVKGYYIRVQSWRCCYCQQRMLTGNLGQWTLDHILSRDVYPHHVFEAANLAVACPDCNRAKHDTDVLSSGHAIKYPRSAKRFKIVHPHYDTWSDHLGTIGMVYFAKSSKGGETIATCKLWRFTARYIDWTDEPADDELEHELEEFMDSNSPHLEVRKVLAKVMK